MSTAEMDQLLTDLVGQRVSVIEADSELSNYLTDAQFDQELALMRRFADAAHARGLRVVWYYPGLEVVTPNGVNIDQTMAKEHPDWLQYGLDGAANVFYGGSGQVFWVEPNDESAWMSPSSPGYRAYFLERVRKIAATGIDGLWVDVPIYADFGPTKWSDFNPDAIARFEGDTGFSIPTAEDWDDPSWRRWITWRHEELARFMQDVTEAARSVDSEFPVFAETLPTDYNGATLYGLDGSYLKHVEGLTHIWEVDTMSNNVGMRNAREDDWISFISALKFTRAASGKKPSWVFSYGKEEDDAELVMAQAMATGNNPYELQVPEMTTTVGAAYRSRMFSWAEEYAVPLFDAESDADVGLLYSSASRDYVDKFEGLGMFATWEAGGDDLWWAADAADSAYARRYLAEFRGILKVLVHAHVPFETVVAPNAIAELARFDTLFVPDLQALSNAEAAMLREYVDRGGHLIWTGPNPSGLDEYGNSRADYALSDVLGFSTASPLPAEQVNPYGAGSVRFFSTRLGKAYFSDGDAGAAQTLLSALNAVHTARVTTNADRRVHLELSRLEDQSILQFVNFIGADGSVSSVPTSFSVSMDIPAGRSVTGVALTAPDATAAAAPQPLDYSVDDGRVSFDVSMNQYAMVLVSFDGAAIPIANTEPVAGKDFIATDVDTPVAFSEADLLANDGDLDGDLPSIVQVSDADAGGSIVETGAGVYTYTPPAGFVGTDFLAYTLSDGRGGIDIGRVAITVAPPTSVYYPLTVDITTGVYDFGSLASFVALDDDTYDIRSAAVSGGRATDWSASTTISESPEEIARIQVTHSGHYSRVGVTQNFYLYNFASAAYELVDSSTVGNESDVPVTAVVVDNIEDFVSADGELRARVSGFKSASSLVSWSNAFYWEVTSQSPEPPGNLAPTAAFSVACSGLTCSFTDSSTDLDGSVVSWEWTFGDEGSSSQTNPTHTFSSSGDFDVLLTVTDDDGAVSSLSQTLSVSASQDGYALVADFGANGLWRRADGAWTRLTTWNAGAGGVAGWSGGLAADFDADGFWI
ncbi:MAG: cadherin-like domain-containing protein, partial [Thiohalocapsa sp.]|nr:cadherin-like domain-containing protein [Thiohalocapsa sp.]